jgi:hypothetical protein
MHEIPHDPDDRLARMTNVRSCHIAAIRAAFEGCAGTRPPEGRFSGPDCSEVPLPERIKENCRKQREFTFGTSMR